MGALAWPAPTLLIVSIFVAWYLLFSGMFERSDRVAWPTGVQEGHEDRRRGLTSQRKQIPAEPTAAAFSPWQGDAERTYGAWFAAEIVDEDVKPVPVEPVRRLS